MKKINIAELLKDCPKGMELDCTVYEGVTLIYVLEDYAYPIKIETPEGQVSLNKYGCYSNNKHSKCVIFPKGKTTWEGFVPPCQFKDGDVVVAEGYESFQLFLLKYFTYSEDGNIHNGYCYFGWDFECNRLFEKGKWGFNRLATKEEKQKLFDAIKSNGYKWNAETKTLEKLIVPRFKEIHFYKDTFGIGDKYESTLKTHDATLIAIQNEWDTIYTYAISALDFSWLLDKGYKIFLHENGKCGELHEGTTELTDKELSKHHDIRKIWIGGGFEDFFYK